MEKLLFSSMRPKIISPHNDRGIDSDQKLIQRIGWPKKLAGNLFAFAGPGYLVAVGYMDPGNWATDLAGGSRYGYTLLPVIVISSLTAIFLQWLALRLGIASGKDLAILCRERFPFPVAICLWLACETAIIACDIAEVIGTAIALKRGQAHLGNRT